MLLLLYETSIPSQPRQKGLFQKILTKSGRYAAGRGAAAASLPRSLPTSRAARPPSKPKNRNRRKRAKPRHERSTWAAGQSGQQAKSASHNPAGSNLQPCLFVTTGTTGVAESGYLSDPTAQKLYVVETGQNQTDVLSLVYTKAGTQNSQ
jgi:hypothetical protein